MPGSGAPSYPSHVPSMLNLDAQPAAHETGSAGELQAVRSSVLHLQGATFKLRQQLRQL
jgi:hypothetical protein